MSASPTRRSRHGIGLGVIAMVVLTSFGGTFVQPAAAAASSAPAPAATAPALDLPAWTGGMNVYRSSGFVTQRSMAWCIAASTQMMVNFVKHQSNTSPARQQRIIGYARAHDYMSNAGSDGSDPQGWAMALRYFGAGRTYAARTYGSYASAIKDAALRMRLTGKPVGLLVGSKGGNHAWVMTGFQATKDPATTSNFRVTSVSIAGPMWPKQIRYKGLYDMTPNTRLSNSTLARAFLRYNQRDGSMKFVGKWVIVAP